MSSTLLRAVLVAFAVLLIGTIQVMAQHAPPPAPPPQGAQEAGASPQEPQPQAPAAPGPQAESQTGPQAGQTEAIPAPPPPPAVQAVPSEPAIPAPPPPPRVQVVPSEPAAPAPNGVPAAGPNPALVRPTPPIAVSAQTSAPIDPALAAAPVACRNAFECLIKSFKERNWRFMRVPGKLALTAVFSSNNGTYTSVAQVVNMRNNVPVVSFYTMTGFHVPEQSRGVMAEFISRANCGITVGNLELDYASGVVRYRTSDDLGSAELTSQAVELLVRRNLATMDQYIPGILEISGGGTSPQAALARVAAGQQPKPVASPPPSGQDAAKPPAAEETVASKSVTHE